MPELPEAENIGRALSNALSGRKICKVEVFTPAMRTPLTPLLEAGLPGRTITAIRRRGRYLTAELDDRRCFVMHFGMSGVVRVETYDVPKRKHEHLFIHLDDGKIFRFECTRRFSFFEVHELPEGKKFPAILDKLGPEPLESDFTPEYLYKRSRKVKGCVKNFIMDNAAVVGIGNIYATEILFASGISPQLPADQLKKTDCAALVKNSVEILHKAIKAGGTTISDFLNVDGSTGAFVTQLKIYGKTGTPCPVCGTVIESVKLGGRTSAYCPKCQKG